MAKRYIPEQRASFYYGGSGRAVHGTNLSPTLDHALVDQTATYLNALSYQFASNSFSDPEGDSLTYTATLSSGAALPGWLSFNSSTRTFSGSPTSTGTITVRVTASDGQNSVYDDFDIVTSNTSPTVANALIDKTATVNSAFSYQFASNSFSDADGNTLTYTATKTDGSAIPSWLTFTSATRTIAGTPDYTNIGTVSIRITASDGLASTHDDFDIVTSDVTRIMPALDAFGTQGGGSTAGATGFTYPTDTNSILVDDLLLAVVTVNDRGSAPTVATNPTGWTLLDSQVSAQQRLAVFWKRAAGTEAGSGAITPFTWGSGDSANDVAVSQLFVIRYADWTGGNPFTTTSVTTVTSFTGYSVPAVTTPVNNSLAFCALGFSDDGTNGALAEPSGGSGGTWYSYANQAFTNGGGDGIFLGALGAEIATAGTITGHTATFVGSSAHHEAVVAIAFGIRGLTNPGTSTVVTKSVAASADDAIENTGTTVVTINGTTQTITSSRLNGFRFTGLSALAGKTIDRAFIQFVGTATEANNQIQVIKCEAADAAAQYAASNTDISARSRTTASRTWKISNWASGESTFKQRTFDFRAAVQEVTDRAGYNAVINVILNNSSGGNPRTCAAQDHATLTEPILTVWYH